MTRLLVALLAFLNLAVFVTSESNAVYMGCYARGALRFENLVAESGQFTRESCKAGCEEALFRYFGMAQGSRCLCGSQLRTSQVSTEECRVPCSGDSTQLCGGAEQQLSVYRSGVPDDEVFEEPSPRPPVTTQAPTTRAPTTTTERATRPPTTTTTERVTRPPTTTTTERVTRPPTTTTTERVTRPPTTTNEGESNAVYMGCYARGALRFENLVAESGQFTRESCKAGCEEALFRYFGMSQGSRCLCGSSLRTSQVSTEECRIPCSGDSTQLCGGAEQQLSVYRSGVPDDEVFEEPSPRPPVTTQAPTTRAPTTTTERVTRPPTTTTTERVTRPPTTTTTERVTRPPTTMNEVFAKISRKFASS